MSARKFACHSTYNKTDLDNENNPTEGGNLFPHMGEL
jgi:hypothetical protein